MIIYEIQQLYDNGCEYITENSWYYLHKDTAEYQITLLEELNSDDRVVYELHHIDVSEDVV